MPQQNLQQIDAGGTHQITLGEHTQASVNRDDMMEAPPCSNAAWQSICRFRNLQTSGGCDQGTQRHASVT